MTKRKTPSQLLPVGTYVHVNHYYGEIIEVVTEIEMMRPDWEAPKTFALRSPQYILQLDMAKKHEWFGADMTPIAHYDLEKNNGRIRLFADEFLVRKTNMTEETELELQRRVCHFLNVRYPDVFFVANPLAGLTLDSWHFQQRLAMFGSSDVWPDIFIVKSCGGMKGLFLELKLPGDNLTNKSGEPVNRSSARQLNVLRRLENEGFAVKIARSLPEAAQFIDAYLAEECEAKILQMEPEVKRLAA